LLVRVARGEQGERTPVWLMRQAGRYMADFRKYSDTIPFRERSETPDIAVELSLQCWRAYGMDGVIMFSDILTPLPAMGIEFDVIKGKGPVISNPPRDMAAVQAMKPLVVSVMFILLILSSTLLVASLMITNYYTWVISRKQYLTCRISISMKIFLAM